MATVDSSDSDNESDNFELNGQLSGGAKKSKSLIPWRSFPENKVLYETLINCVIAEGIHKVDRAKVKSAWEDFAVVVFSQPAFKSKGHKCKAASLRTVYNDYIQKRAEANNWYDKSSKSFKNISGLEGNLSPMDVQIRQILLDVEEINEKRIVFSSAQGIQTALMWPHNPTQ